jgi:hypothetical protein
MFLFVTLRLLLVGQQTECPRQRHSRCLRSSQLTSAWQRPVPAPECQLVVRLVRNDTPRIFKIAVDPVTAQSWTRISSKLYSLKPAVKSILT